jgi:hypothetical protein
MCTNTQCTTDFCALLLYIRTEQAAAASSVQLPSFIEQCNSGFDTVRTHFSTTTTSTPAAVMFTLPVPDTAAALITLQSWATHDTISTTNSGSIANNSTAAQRSGIDCVRSSSRNGSGSNSKLQVSEVKLAPAPTISVLQCTYHSAVIGWSGAGVAVLELFGPQVDAPTDMVSSPSCIYTVSYVGCHC